MILSPVTQVNTADQQQFISYHESLMKTIHQPSFINDIRQNKLAILVKFIGKTFQVSRASVWRLKNHKIGIETEILYSLGEGFDYTPNRLSQTTNPPYFEALEEARIINADDAATDARTRLFNTDYITLLDIQTLLDVPIFDRGALSGVLSLESTTKRSWSVPEMSLATAIADTISLINTQTSWQQTQRELSFIKQYDAVTGLPNSASMRTHLESLISATPLQNKTISKTETVFSLLWIGIKQLDHIEDAVGQSIGADILRTLTSRLEEKFIAGKDLLSRGRHHDFVMLIQNRIQRDDVTDIAQSLQQKIAEPMPIGQQTLHLHASIGISFYPEHGSDAGQLLRNSETAMLTASKSITSNLCFYHDRLLASAQSALLLETQLRQALNEKALVVHYQPIVSSDTQSLSMLEALVRWPHHERGLLSPYHFLSQARAAGLMQQLGDVVFELVCRDLTSMNRAGITLPKIAINLASEQFRQADTPDKFQSIMSEHELSGQNFEIEITEDDLQGSLDEMSKCIRGFVERGMEVSIDDFGTGYSSLARLKTMPFSKIKIDRSFIMDIEPSSDECAIVRSILGLAKGIGLSVVAEGVETAYQESWLQHQGCDYLQGYRYSKPCALSDIVQKYFS